MHATPLSERRKRCEQGLASRGLDLYTWFRLGDLNAQLSPDERIVAEDDALGVLVGNSRAIWEPFVSWADKSASSGAHPLDQYVEETVRAAASACGEIAWLRFAHQIEPAPIPIQRYAHLLGLAHLGPAHLSVHSRCGPWIGLRAMVLFEESAPHLPLTAAPAPCTECVAPCKTALEAALSSQDRSLAVSGHHPPQLLTKRSQRFLAVRDVCPVGRSFRYSDPQIVYHYDKKPIALSPQDTNS